MAKKKRAAKKTPAAPALEEHANDAPRVNKSEAIRNYLAEHEDLAPKEVAAALTEELGVEVTSAFVSQVKGKLGRKKENATAQKKAPMENAKPPETYAVRDLLAARKLVAEVGGIEKAKETLNVLGKLM